MAKLRNKYVCSECGYESSGWLGKCPSCLKWNTFIEEVYEENSYDKSLSHAPLPASISLSEIENIEVSRIGTGSM